MPNGVYTFNAVNVLLCFSSDKYGPVDIFVPYDLRNSLICYLALFSHSDIFIPIEEAILKNAVYGESDRVLEQTP